MGVCKRLCVGMTFILSLMLCSVTPLLTVKAAEEKCIPTSILGENQEYCESGNGSGVRDILTSIVDILSVGVGVLGVLGITIVGIQYLTAGGSEEKTRKAKQRMLEIVIGLVAYVLIYAILKWLKVA